MANRFVLLFLAMALTVVPARAAPPPESPPAVDPPAMTHGELERQLEDARRQLEDLLVEIERQDEPTPEQVEQSHELRQRITDLEAQLREGEKPPPAAKPDGWKVRWALYRSTLRDLTRYDLADGMFRFSMGVRLQADGTAVFESDRLEAELGDLPNGFDLRRGRLYMEGRILRRMDFEFEYDLGIDSGVKRAYLEGARGFGRWRVGIFKEPFSLERYTSSYDDGFLEGSLPVETFAPGANLGAMLRSPRSEERYTWAVSVTTSANEGADNSGPSDVSFTGRATGLPVYRRNGRQIVHLGVGISARDPAEATLQYKSRPEARFVSAFLNTGELSVDGNALLGFEFATVQGPWWVQYEWIQSRLSATDLKDPVFSGSYIESGYFLTGETRPYGTQDGTFGRVLPLSSYKLKGNPFKRGSHGGALELTGRLSTISLNDGLVKAGKLDDLTLGMNWYLSPATRFMLNYIHSSIERGGYANIVLIRYQFNP